MNPKPEESSRRSRRQRPARQPAAGPSQQGPAPRQERRWLWGLFAAALLLRLYYLHALKQTPFFEPLSPTLDDGVYDIRGLEIAAGAWLGKPSWLVYTTPLYPYFLGVIYRIFGHAIVAVHLIQTGLGACTPLLVYGLAKEAFGSRRAPLLAGALASVLVFYPVRHLRFAVPYNSLGIYYADKGDWLKAENCYRKSIQLSPNFPDPNHNLFMLYRDLGDAQKAQDLEAQYEELKRAELAAGRGAEQ